MNLDPFGTPVFDDNDVFDILYSGNTRLLPKIVITPSSEITNFENISGLTVNKQHIIQRSLTDFDQQHQSEWYIDEEYVNFDIAQWVRSQCETDVQLARVNEELEEFSKRNLLILLKWLKFFVDTCRKNKVLWGVGRGSSVSSYVLYKIGVHRVDSIKYNLDWQEFLR